jgi:hypothetical protein
VPAFHFTTRVYELKSLKLHYLKVPKEVIEKGGAMMKKRLICTADKSVTWPCGLVALRGGNAYIIINKKIMKQLGIALGDAVAVSLKKDAGPYGMSMCDELKTLLDQDQEGHRRFQRLPPSKRRYIIYYVAQVKSSQLRIDRSIRLIENLKRTVEGKESFREILAARK